MASIDDSSVIFFSKATPIQWSFVLDLYRDVFEIHAERTRGSKKNGPAELIKLDVWYQEQLPQLIRSRKEHQLFYDELIQITKWKLLRGKFRPSLLDLVKTNTELAVKNVTKKAFRKMPNISQAINALTQLKGIGLATASAVLVAYSPDVCPFAADESMIATPGVENSDYTCAEYMNYVEKVDALVDKLRKIDPDSNWTPHKVELAMWTHYQIKKYNLTHLDNMPLEIVSNSVQESNNEVSNDLNNEEVRSTSKNDEECNQIINGNDDNQVDSSDINEIDLNSNSNSNLIDSNSNLVDLNSNLTSNNFESSSHILSNGMSENITQSDSESLSNGLSLNLIHKNLDEDISNLSSAISSNSIDDQSYGSSSLQLNKAIQSIQEDSSNNVSSTNGISQSEREDHRTIEGNGYKLNNLIMSNGKEESTNESNNQLNSNSVNSSLIKQHLITSNSQDNLSQPNTTNDSLEKFSTISSSCENSNNVNSSEDSIQLMNKKRSNSSTSSSLSNLTKQQTSRTVNNCSETLDLNVLDDNAVPFDSSDSEPLSKRQKLIN